MDKTLRSILCILVGLVVLSSFSAGWFFIAKENLYKSHVNLEDLFKVTTQKLNREISSLNNENTALSSKLDEIEREIKILDERNKNMEFKYEGLLREKDDLDKELVRVKKGKRFLEKRLETVKSRDFMANLLKEKVSLEVELEKLKNSLAPKDSEIAKLEQKIMILEVSFTKLEKEKNLLEQSTKDYMKVAEILSMDLLKEKDKTKEINQKFATTGREKNLLRTRIVELEKVSSEFNKLLTEKKDANFKISSLQKELELKDKTIDEMNVVLKSNMKEKEQFRAEAYHAPNEVDLPPIVLERNTHTESRVVPPTLKRIDVSLKGRVVTINRDHNFVVIDLGKQDGVDVGTNFDVYRDNTFVGSIRAIQSRERIAACDIEDESLGIEIDDLIVKR